MWVAGPMDDVVKLLCDVSNAFRTHLQEMESIHATGLTPFQARLLAALHRHPGSSQQELARRTGRDKAQITRTIRDLENNGMITRDAHESDWRSFRVTLTDEGARACSLLTEERATLSSTATAGLSSDERRVLAISLSRMKTNLDQRGALEDRAAGGVRSARELDDPPSTPDTGSGPD